MVFAMATEAPHSIEEFFRLFHEPFLLWTEDFETIRDKGLFETEFSKAYADTLILHYAALVEKLCSLLATQYAEFYKLPVPRGVKSADELRTILKRLREATTAILGTRGVSRFQDETGKKLRALIHLDLDDILKHKGFH